MTDFEQLYETYFNDVYLYILRLSGNEHIAEEITSDTSQAASVFSAPGSRHWPLETPRNDWSVISWKI